MTDKREMVKVMLSQTLKIFVDQHRDNEKVIDQIGQSLDKGIEYIQKMPRGHARVKRIYEDIDTAISMGVEQMEGELEKKDLPSCKRGCTHCCHSFVTTTNEEADYIFAIAKEKNIPLSKKRLAYQARFRNPSDYFTRFGKRTRCVFLDDKDDCMIYEQRPIACRKYFVTTDPEKCKPTPDHEFQGVATRCILPVEILASAHLNLDLLDTGEDGEKINHSLAARLLKRVGK